MEYSQITSFIREHPWISRFNDRSVQATAEGQCVFSNGMHVNF